MSSTTTTTSTSTTSPTSGFLLALYVEQAVWVALSIVLICLYFIQLNAENHPRKKMEAKSIKYKFHRIGALCAVLQLVIGIDPLAVQGIYNWIIPFWITQAALGLIIIGIVNLKYASLEALYKSRLQNVPFLVHFQAYFFGFGCFILPHATYGLALYYNRWWYTSIWCWFVTAVLFVEAFSFVGITWVLARDLQVSMKNVSTATRSKPSANDHQSKLEEKANSEKRLLMFRAGLIFCSCAILIPFEALEAKRVLDDTSAARRDTNLDSFDITDRVANYFQWIVLFIFLWYSWIPIRPPPEPVREAQREYSRVSLSQQRQTWKNASLSRVNQYSRAQASQNSVGPDDEPPPLTADMFKGNGDFDEDWLGGDEPPGFEDDEMPPDEYDVPYDENEDFDRQVGLE